MNPLHYPSLEPCKKLTEAGFPDTELSNGSWWIDSIPYSTYAKWETTRTVCPSVMELIDKLPTKHYDQDAELSLHMLRDNICRVWYMHMWWYIWMYFHGTVPNALTEMWLYLKNNNSLPTK